MRIVVVAALLAGCSKNAEPTAGSATPSTPSAPSAPLASPVDPALPVAPGIALATAPKPAAVVFVSATGAYEVATTRDGQRAPAADLDAVRAAVIGDPPPPDDTGGTGTAMRLDEGKMGKRDPERAAGQYKMKKETDDPQLARLQALQQARNAGFLDGDERPQRGELAGTRARALAELPPYGPLVVASAKAPAIAVARVLADLGGLIAVAGDPPMVVDVAFRGRWLDIAGGELPWLEVTRNDGKIAIVNAKDLAVRPVEQAGLVALALELGTVDERIDILASDFTTQELVDAIVALRAAGWKRISVVADEADAGQRAAKLKLALGPYLSIGASTVFGDLDKPIIRRYIKRVEPELLTCYTDPLVKDPDLDGTVAAQFTIAPDGRVGTATASGVSTGVATCVANVIKTIEFPRVRGGGSVQVNYPFTYRRGR